MYSTDQVISHAWGVKRQAAKGGSTAHSISRFLPVSKTSSHRSFNSNYTRVNVLDLNRRLPGHHAVSLVATTPG